MKIDNSKSVPTPGTGQTNATRTNPAATPLAKPAGGERQDTVEINPRAAQLQALESTLASVPVVDTARVEQIKQAISEGRFQINADKIADKLLDTVKELVRVQKN